MKRGGSPTKVGQPVTLHPTIFTVIHVLYNLPAVRMAVWDCRTVPEAKKDTPAEDLQPHRFVRVLQQIFLKIHKGEPFGPADMQWSQKIAGIAGNVCFDLCRNYMLGLLIHAIPELDDLLQFACELEHHYPELGLVETADPPDVPLTFGAPALESVEQEIRDASQMGHGALHRVPLPESASDDIKARFRKMGRRVGDEVLCITNCRYERYSFCPLLVMDRWTTHPCTPARNQRTMSVRISPDPQLRPPPQIDLAPLFPWPYEVDAQQQMPYSLFAIVVMRAYDWAENFAEGTEVQGNIPTAMGTCAAYINQGMSGQWLEVDRAKTRSVDQGTVTSTLLQPNVMVVSYVYVSDEQRPTLFPPPSSLEVPPGLLSLACANPDCGAETTEGARFPMCSKCHVVGYCNPACQKAHWKQHKIVCSSTSVLDDVCVPAEPALSIRPPFGRNCHVCSAVKAQQDLAHLRSMDRHGLLQYAALLHVPLPPDNETLDALTDADIAQMIFDHTHPSKARERAERLAARRAEAGEDEGEEEEEVSEIDEYDLPPRDKRKGETVIGRYALHVVILIVGILMAISFSAY
eukprot:TRINITY_DN6310_c0_g1_i1.p2 TRINITY_DN6310_c0_g1~~TRINITY_DN6310_c0_g1_i1.p2  ORF type:complete len:595 (+),score=241.03 TRINITY_DN6310_c0_g1_i1:60-1787(+)